MCGVLTFCWTSAIRLPPPAVVLSLSTCLYQLVCINLSLWTCLYKFVSINLSLSTCLYQPVSINLSPSTCLYQFVFINLSLVALDAAAPLRGRRGTWWLSPLVSHCTPPCFPLLDGVSAFPRVWPPFVSHCARSCFSLLGGVSSFPRGWCVRLPKVLSPLVVFHCLPSSCFPFLDRVPALSGSCLPWSPIGPHGLHSLPLSPHTCACVGRCVCLPEVLSPLVSLLVYPCLRLSPIVSTHDPPAARRIRQPHDHKSLFPIVSHCLQLSPHLCAHVGWSTFPKSSRKSWNVNGRTWSQRRIMSFPTSSPVAPQVRKAKTAHRNTKPLILF